MVIGKYFLSVLLRNDLTGCSSSPEDYFNWCAEWVQRSPYYPLLWFLLNRGGGVCFVVTVEQFERSDRCWCLIRYGMTQ